MSVLKGLLTAREGSYFKTEQEDELQVYRRRRIKEGAIKDDPRLPGEGPRGFVSIGEAGRDSRAGGETLSPARGLEATDVVAAAEHIHEGRVPNSTGHGHRPVQGTLTATKPMERAQLARFGGPERFARRDAGVVEAQSHDGQVVGGRHARVAVRDADRRRGYSRDHGAHGVVLRRPLRG